MKKMKYLLLFISLISVSAVFSQGLIIQPGACMTVASGAYVKTTGSAGLTIKSDVTGTGSLVDYNSTGANIVAGFNNVERYLTSERWHYLCPPVVNSTAMPLYGMWVKYYQEPLQHWKFVIDQDTALPVMGYAAWTTADATPVFSGTLNSGPVTYNLTRTLISGTLYNGWNFVGNPYPSAIDWNAASGWTKTNIDNSIYYWNGVNYSYFVGSGTEPYSGTGSVNNGSQFIPAMQGFMVHVSMGNTTGTLTVNNNARVHSGTAFYKDAPEVPVVRLVASFQDKTDELLVRAIPEASTEFDGDFDAYKLFAGNIHQIYSVTPETSKLAINTVPEFTKSLQIPVGFMFDDAGEYSISATEIQLGEGMVVYLDDLKNNKSQNLLQLPDYSFTAVTGDNPDRFVLKFKETPIGIDDQNMQNNSFQVYTTGSTLYVKKLTAQNAAGTIEIYDMIGRRVFNSVLEDLIVNRYELSLTEGYYLARLYNDNRVMTQKIFIH
jgi:fibronectin-binding autotransporter adhesin